MKISEGRNRRFESTVCCSGSVRSASELIASGVVSHEAAAGSVIVQSVGYCDRSEDALSDSPAVPVGQLVAFAFFLVHG